jgi:hypothetical protein
MLESRKHDDPTAGSCKRNKLGADDDDDDELTRSSKKNKTISDGGGETTNELLISGLAFLTIYNLPQHACFLVTAQPELATHIYIYCVDHVPSTRR